MNKKILFIVLIVAIIIGIFLRVYGIDSQLLIGDEPVLAVSAMKFFHSSFKFGVSFEPSTPPFGKFIMGLPSLFIDSNYDSIFGIGITEFIYVYYAFESISDNYVFMKILLTFFSVLSILFIYLISKELFGSKAAIWSAILSALSFDLIIYSRIIYMRSFILFFSLGCLYFFIKYLKIKDKVRYLYLVLCYLFLFFAVGSHHVQPWFLIPVLIASQFLFNKKLREDILVSVGYLASFGLMWLIYISYSKRNIFQEIARTYISTNSFGSLFLKKISFTFHDIILGFLLRNNYVLSLISLICAFVFFKLLFKKKLFGKIKKIVVSRDLKLIILMLFVVSFVGLGFTSLGSEMRHVLFLFIPLYIFSGFVINKLVRKKNILYLVVLLLLISVVQGVYNSPASIVNYSNFGVSSYQAEHYDDGLHNEIIGYLEDLGNPPVMTNDVNILLFYEGIKKPLTTFKNNCNDNFIEKFRKDKFYILYKGELTGEDHMLFRTVDFNGEERVYFCYLLLPIIDNKDDILFDPLEKVYKFDYNLMLYRFK